MYYLHAPKENASILGNFNFDLSSYYPSAELTIQFSSDRMKDCILVQFVSDNLDVFEFPEEGYWGLYIGVDINEKVKISTKSNIIMQIGENSIKSYLAMNMGAVAEIRYLLILLLKTQKF